ncbi:helix-turn-helix domain-containing protein [Leucobacter sp. W1478]|uniref:helix-turn-helix domain-containing protein n=1 Tax=Leucobacter sp. W1478 TaxID=3439065 RepID=UPI003F36CA24
MSVTAPCIGPSEEAPGYISISEAARRINLCTKTVRRMISRGELPARRFGKRIIRIPADALDDLGRPIAPWSHS